MFQKTRLRLTLLNSMVFIIIIILLSRTIYFYTETQVYRDIDQSLLQANQRMIKPPVGEILLGTGPSVIIWGPDQKIIEPQMGDDNFFKINEAKLFPGVFNKIEAKEVDGAFFRTISTQMDTQYGKITVQFIRSVDAERAILDQFFLILLIGGGLGSLVAIAAGYFLAGRALVPIRKSWEQQQQFVSDASHEIRTPLAVIQSRTDLLFQEPSATIEEKAVDISIISKEVRRLNKLVNSLLTLTRSDSNQMEIKKANFFLDELVMDIMKQYEDIAAFQEKSMTSYAPEQVVFFGDQERIHQLLVILVDNALKFTDVGGEVSLSCIKNASSIVLAVEDNGIGIPKEGIPKIFDRFYQVEKSRTKNEGSGLGLSIAKWIVEAHQGTIKVTSEPNKKTRFEMTFSRNMKNK